MNNGNTDVRGSVDVATAEVTPTATPSATPTYDVVFEEVDFKPTLEYIRAHLDEFVTSGDPIYMEGEKTRGKTISIAGRDVQLPETVIVQAYVVSIECDDRRQCPRTPAITLRDIDAGLSIFVEGPTGKISDSNQTPDDRIEESRQIFRWLYDEVSKIKVSPTDEATRAPEDAKASAFLATPTPTATPTHFIYPIQHDLQEPQVTPVNEEHYIFQPAYLNMMFEEEDLPYVVKRIRFYVDSYIRSETLSAIADWNAVRPPEHLDMIEASTIGASNLRIYNILCPLPKDLQASGCFTVATWQGISWGGTTPVNNWLVANIMITPSSPTRIYDGTTRRGTIAHEIGHALGLADQYMLYPGAKCNNAVTTIMDANEGYTIGPVTHINKCHNLSGPQSIDATWWGQYQHQGSYIYYTHVLYPDGKLAYSFKDLYWNDWLLEADWQWSSNGTTGWTPFTRIGYVNDNGTQYNVYGASGRRIIVSGYPSNYNVHGKYIRLCVRAIWSWIPRGAYDGWDCTTAGVVWYPY